MPAIEFLIIYLLLGAVVGFMAGLLGIGGGGIMVPILTTVFIAQGFSLEHVVHLALGTSMASIIITSFSSFRAHHLKQGVIWEIVKSMAPGVILGAFVATFLVASMSTLALAVFFALFMAYVSVQMFLNKQPKPSRQVPGAIGLSIVATGIGVISALVAIGGGSLTVPFLVWSNIDMRKAIGTSAAIGFPIAIAGTTGYLLTGWDATIQQPNTFGFIYLPAVIAISILSYITAPIGAKLAHQLPIPTLKKIFALVLIALSVKMLLSII